MTLNMNGQMEQIHAKYTDMVMTQDDNDLIRIPMKGLQTSLLLNQQRDESLLQQDNEISDEQVLSEYKEQLKQELFDCIDMLKYQNEIQMAEMKRTHETALSIFDHEQAEKEKQLIIQSKREFESGIAKIKQQLQEASQQKINRHALQSKQKNISIINQIKLQLEIEGEQKYKAMEQLQLAELDSLDNKLEEYKIIKLNLESAQSFSMVKFKREQSQNQNINQDFFEYMLMLNTEDLHHYIISAYQRLNSPSTIPLSTMQLDQSEMRGIVQSFADKYQKEKTDLTQILQDLANQIEANNTQNQLFLHSQQQESKPNIIVISELKASKHVLEEEILSKNKILESQNILLSQQNSSHQQENMYENICKMKRALQSDIQNKQNQLNSLLQHFQQQQQQQQQVFSSSIYFQTNPFQSQSNKIKVSPLEKQKQSSSISMIEIDNKNNKLHQVIENLITKISKQHSDLQDANLQLQLSNEIIFNEKQTLLKDKQKILNFDNLQQLGFKKLKLPNQMNGIKEDIAQKDKQFQQSLNQEQQNHWSNSAKEHSKYIMKLRNHNKLENYRSLSVQNNNQNSKNIRSSLDFALIAKQQKEFINKHHW